MCTAKILPFVIAMPQTRAERERLPRLEHGSRKGNILVVRFCKQHHLAGDLSDVASERAPTRRRYVLHVLISLLKRWTVYTVHFCLHYSTRWRCDLAMIHL